MAPHHNFIDERTLDKIDRLSTAGVGRYISLPQLVVVGDQSSGKSSVLEGLTKLPFPRDSGLCTRFATQITFRRGKTKSISVSIIPSKHATPDEAEHLRLWKKDDLTELDEGSFAEIMKEVNNVMQLRDSQGKGGKKTFSEDVLKLDISGPAEQHFSIVDVPGIFRVATEGLTTDKDKTMVRSMVQGYMANPNSVILAVLPANVDVATQEILTLAKESDPNGIRTLGVLTKPDLVDRGAENGVIDLLKGTKYKLKLGWCVVRNLSQKELNTMGTDRTSLEDNFFRTAEPWHQIDKDQVGVESLRSRLSVVLADVIRRTFPSVKLEISKQLKGAIAHLEELGASRKTSVEQMGYLTAISAKFETVVKEALSAKYTGNEWFDSSQERKIATLIVNRNEALEKSIRLFGHKYKFVLNDEEDRKPARTKQKGATASKQTGGFPGSFPLGTQPVSKSNSSIFGANPSGPLPSGSTSEPCKSNSNMLFGSSALSQNNAFGMPSFTGKGFAQEHTEPHKPWGFPLNSMTANTGLSAWKPFVMSPDSDLEELGISLAEQIDPTKDGILAWINNEYKQSRGFELGTFNSTLISTFMKVQTEKWEPIAFGYIHDVITACHAFIKDLLVFVCPDERVRDSLLSVLMDGLTERYKLAFENVKFLLYTERFGPPATVNHYFNDNLQKCRQIRMQRSAEKHSIIRKGTGSESESSDDERVVRVKDIGVISNQSNAEYSVAEIHDILKSYYKVALKRFADNLCIQSASYYMVSGPDTPLGLLSPKFIAGLSTDQLAAICEEDGALAKTRAHLATKIESLKKAKKIVT